MYSCVIIYMKFDVHNPFLALYVFIYSYKQSALLEMAYSREGFPHPSRVLGVETHIAQAP